MTKSELRKEYLSRQKAISHHDRAAKSRRIAIRFFETCDLSRIRHLHCFLPIEKFNEIDTRQILVKIWREYRHIQTVAPHVEFETGEMLSVKFGPDTVLAKNEWDIEEPAHDEIVEPEMIDLVLTPGVCFDRAGHRVGYGKGFYDRFLKKCRPDCVKIGLSYFEPVDRIDDVHEGDVQVDSVINAASPP